MGPEIWDAVGCVVLGFIPRKKMEASFTVSLFLLLARTYLPVASLGRTVGHGAWNSNRDLPVLEEIAEVMWGRHEYQWRMPQSTLGFILRCNYRSYQYDPIIS